MPPVPTSASTGVPTWAREYLSGSLAASLTYTLFSPLEVVKTRLQVQDSVGFTRVYTRGFLGALRDLLSHDGLLLSWNHGLAAGVGRDFFYSGVRTGMYPTVRDGIAGSATDASLVQKIAAGATTGSAGSALANVFDVVRVRMITEGGRIDPTSGQLSTGLRTGHAPRWSSSMNCLADTARSEGVVSGLLLRGVTASMSRAALLTAAQMSTYDHAKTIARRNGFEETTRLHVAAALFSGLVATVACNPADVIKSRIMTARADGGGGSGTLGIAWQIATREGVAGFYRGFLPAYARIGPTILIQLPVAEALRRRMGVRAL